MSMNKAVVVALMVVGATVLPVAAAQTTSGDETPTAETLGFPVYPNAQYLTSYDCWARTALLSLRIQLALRGHGSVLLRDPSMSAVTAVFDAPPHAHLRNRSVPRGEHGVSARCDDQGLHLERVGMGT